MHEHAQDRYSRTIRSVAENVSGKTRIKMLAARPVIQRQINILPGPDGGAAARWSAAQALANLPPDTLAALADRGILIAVLGEMDAQNWFGASYAGFYAEVAGRYGRRQQQLKQQQQPAQPQQAAQGDPLHGEAADLPELEDDQLLADRDDQMAEAGQHPLDFLDDAEPARQPAAAEHQPAAPAAPARTHPTGIERSAAMVDYNPANGYYGATFVTGFTSSSGDEEATDLQGIQIRETVSVGRNDLLAPPRIETAETVINEMGMITDEIGTNADRIHAGVPLLRNFPAVYETPQTLHWRYAGEGNGAWRHLADIHIVVEVRDSSLATDQFRTLTVVTTYNGQSVVQNYLGPRVRRQ
jgi:hypothetical protein